MFRFKNYFSDAWNGFDFFIVAGSLVDLGIAQLAPDANMASISFLRLFRYMLWPAQIAPDAFSAILEYVYDHIKILNWQVIGSIPVWNDKLSITMKKYISIIYIKASYKNQR